MGWTLYRMGRYQEALKHLRRAMEINGDPEIAAAAAEYGVTLRDVRKPPPVNSLHFFSGKVEEVRSLKIALLGTDSAVGKRTTAWLLHDALEAQGEVAISSTCTVFAESELGLECERLVGADRLFDAFDENLFRVVLWALIRCIDRHVIDPSSLDVMRDQSAGRGGIEDPV